MSRGRLVSSLLRAAARAARSSEQSGQYVARRMISTNGAGLAAAGAGVLSIFRHTPLLIASRACQSLRFSVDLAGRRMLGVSSWQMQIPLAAQGVRHISLDALKPSDK